MGEENRIESNLWEQRVDPWMVFWPVLVLGLSGLFTLTWVIGGALANPSYLSVQLSWLDQYFLALLGSDGTRISLVLIAIVSAIIGVIVYLRLTRESYSEDETQFFLSRQLVWVILLWTIIPALVNTIFTFTVLQESFGQFISDTILCIFYGIGSVVGLGLVSDYYNFTLNAKSTNSRVHLYLMRKGDRPSIVVDATDIIGGYFYLLFDSRVVRAVMKVVPLPPHQIGDPRKTPDQVRRDQHLRW